MVRKHPLNWLGSAELLFIVILFLSLNAFAEPLIQTGFDSGADGFSYQDDSFRSTSAPAYADGSWNPTEAALQIDLGGIDKSDIFGMSGGWQRDFELGGLSEVVLSFRYNLTQSAWYESNEQSQILVSIDGVLIGVSPNDYIDQVTGNGNGGPDETTGWQSVELNLGSLAAGSHRLTLGGYNNQKTHYTEYTTLLIDDLSLNALSSNQPPTAVASATPDNGVAPLEVSFSSAGSTDADGSIQSYSWRFGDGSSASEANPSHSYTSPGSYTATLTVTDDQGGTGSASVTISVSDVPDTEAPGIPTGLSASANGPATINLSWSAATDNVGVTGYRIFRDETEIATATTTSYSDSGLDPETTYSYSVTAYDAAGNESAPGEAAEATTGALPILTSLSLNPSSAALSVGTSQQFSASGLDQYGNAIATSPVWSVSGGGTIDQTGRFTASSAGGPFTILADDGGISASATVTITQNTTLIETGFDSDSDGFSYVDDAYRGTSAPGFADGSHQPAGGFSGGGLEVVLGGINGDDIFGMSGGWQRDFELGGLSEVTLSFRYNLTQSPFYEDNEFGQILVSLDGVLIGVSPNDHIDQISGNGNGGPDETTSWQQVELNLGSLAAGTHTLILGGYNNQKTAANESTRIQLDDLLLRTTSSNQPPTAVASATPDNGVAPLEVSFSSAGSTDADGSIQSYSWRFGDGSSASEANPSHSYTSPGSYTATLTVTDDQGGSDSSSLMIVVAEAPDTVAPVITLNGGSSVTREAGPVAYSDPGATASDDRDGDLSANLQASGSVDHTTAGTYILTYQVADAAGNQATVTRTVIVVAGSAPVITLLGDDPMILQAGDTFVDPGATANDTFDGDLSGSIVVSGVVDSSTAGSYTVTYSVTDAAGNSASASRSVEVVDSSDPVITLEGDNPVAIEAGTPFIDPGASAEDDVDGDITDRILVDGEVDIEAAGSYQLTYTVSDSAGNTATVIRTVNVVAASAPIIVLLGDNPYEVELGVEFSDPGATANDAFDGDISDRIEVTGSVDSGSVGSYMLVYSVSDNAGNSTEEMRTVLVVENPPVEFNVSNNIHVDQFGYLPDGEKMAVIAAPQEGFNSADTFAPGSDYQVRRTADDSIAFIGALTQWNEGATNDQSGDKAWWFDFSELTETGEFYVYDPENEAASHPFDIRADVYIDVLKQAVRSYFYQRVNFAKQEPYADPRWVDNASHGGAEQDYDVRAMIPEDPESSDPATGRDLHGGWYDAGDYNKYINYADGTVHNLLYAYQERPAVWGDDYQIPESGNGVPDLLDEVRWEMEWMLRMQIEDGSVLHKLASINWNGGSPPSSDVTPRRYAPPTASATISAAGAYAHAALVYSDFNAEFAGTLRQAALDAWDWLEENPESIPSNFDNAGFVNAAAEDCGYDDARCESHQLANRLNAAIHLFALTGEQRFQDYILAHAESDTLLLGEGGYLVFDGMQQEVQDALIYYAGLDGADAGLVETIQAQLLRAMSLPEEWVPFSPLARFQEQKDPYRAYLDEHHWGSNRGKGNAGNLMFSTAESGFDPGNSGDYGSAAQGYLHYLHGVNPHNIAYLSNMDEFGADNSVPEFYHLWFNDGSELWDGVENSLYGPAPGYLVGGPNEHYWRDGVYIDDIEDAAHRLNNQPSMKRYWSWNGSENSYEITENSITYQAPYIRLLSKYLPGSSNEIWRPAPGTSWQWQINSGEVDTSFNVDMYDVDLFEASEELIASLKAQGRVVICYFSAGSFEDWRSDAEDFPASVIGNQLDEWPGESWLDIRDIDQLGPIMAARLDLAVAKGCDGVEPDNVDGYTNSSGFELTGEDQLAYNRWLAAQAHQRGLSIGLKNDLNQIEALLDDFDWALNEQCFEYEECDLLMPFIEAGKAVFGVTYGDAADAICPVANEMGFSWLMKNWDLDAWRIDCLEYGGGE